MDTSIISSLIGTDLTGIITNALIVNFATLGARFGWVAVQDAIDKSPIPITIDMEKAQQTTVFTVLCSLFVSVLLVMKMDQGSFVWYNFIVNSIIIWFSAFVTWKLGIRQLCDLVPSLITALTNKIKGLSQ